MKRSVTRAALCGLGLLTSIAPAWAQPLAADPLAALINAYRAKPADCDGASVAPVAPLVAEPVLAQIRIGFGTFIESALEQAGYATDGADSVDVTGPEDAAAAMRVLQQRYCKVLRSERFSAVGSYREGTTWTVVLARPAPPLPSSTYPDWRDAGRAILEAVNLARASARMCGDRAFAAAPPLKWNALLGEAALAHSLDMANRRYFNHYAQDGSDPADRATRAGYRWHRLGENIAFGQYSPQEAVDGWIDSPGHCANIMQADFTEMGAAYGVTADRQAGIIYWTQVLGTRR